MSDQDRYAHGHDAKRAVSVRHHQWCLPDQNGPAELRLTSEDGLHYVFAFTSQQLWKTIREAVERKSRMSDTKRGA